jgi:hypothetical protein
LTVGLEIKYFSESIVCFLKAKTSLPSFLAEAFAAIMGLPPDFNQISGQSTFIFSINLSKSNQTKILFPPF